MAKTVGHNERSAWEDVESEVKGEGYNSDADSKMRVEREGVYGKGARR